MDYRIVIETERSGKKWYCVQKRFLLYFWQYMREVRDITMYKYRRHFETMEEAERCIQDDVNYQYERNQSKIVKREIFVK